MSSLLADLFSEEGAEDPPLYSVQRDHGRRVCRRGADDEYQLRRRERSPRVVRHVFDSDRLRAVVVHEGDLPCCKAEREGLARSRVFQRDKDGCPVRCGEGVAVRLLDRLCPEHASGQIARYVARDAAGRGYRAGDFKQACQLKIGEFGVRCSHSEPPL